jgi:DNA-binding NtrC family response regulator
LKINSIHGSFGNNGRLGGIVEWRISLKTRGFSEGMELASIFSMKNIEKKILIFDEAGFSRVCSAILEKEGYGTNAITDVCQLDSKVNYKDFGLVITSYPYGEALLEKLITSRIPTIILSDQVSRDLMAKLDHFDKTLSHCMIKPLDYHKFRILVNQVMRKDSMDEGLFTL